MSSTDVTRATDAAEVLRNLEAAGFKKLPANEAQCRVLAKWNDVKQAEYWKKVTESGKKITAAAIAKVAGLKSSTPKVEGEKRRVEFEASDLDKMEKTAQEKGKTTVTIIARCDEAQATILQSALQANMDGFDGVYTLTTSNVEGVEAAFAKFGAWVSDNKVKSGQFGFAVV